MHVGNLDFEALTGKAEVAVDDKRRFSLPPKYRPRFGSRETPSGYTHHAILVPWYGGSLAVMPESYWAEIQARLFALEYSTPDFLEATRQCTSCIEYVHTDPEGRLSLTPDLGEWLRLPARGKAKVVVAGAVRYLEVWNAVEYASVARTGRNDATRPASDIEYDKKLEMLMRAGREAGAAARRPEAGAPGAEGADSEG